MFCLTEILDKLIYIFWAEQCAFVENMRKGKVVPLLN
jgi:hypothetical protein